MTTAKKEKNKKISNKTKRGNEKKKIKYLQIGKLKLRRKWIVFVACVIVLIVSFVLFRNSDFWPWPSQSEIDQRLNDVLDACMYNENSRACKNTTSKYNLEFKYCYALSDIPEIDNYMPIYGVAQQKNFFTDPLQYDYRYEVKGYSSSQDSATQSNNEENIVYPYYGCAGSIDEVRRQKGPSLIDGPDTMALFGLSVVPDYRLSGDYYGCVAGWYDFNSLWRQIPNASKIFNEGENIRNIYNKCSMLPDAKVAASSLNERLESYANNYSVQLFYQKFDEWGQSNRSKCTWYDKEFMQHCTDSKEGFGLTDFTNEMYRYLHTKYFTSRVTIAN